MGGDLTDLSQSTVVMGGDLDLTDLSQSTVVMGGDHSQSTIGMAVVQARASVLAQRRPVRPVRPVRSLDGPDNTPASHHVALLIDDTALQHAQPD